MIFGVVTGVVTTVLGIAGLMFLLEANLEAKTERAANGEVVYETRGSKNLLAILALPVALGFAAGLSVFKAMGGRVDPTYGRGLSD